MSKTSEYGLASTLIGAVVILCVPVVLLLATNVWAYASRSPQTVVLHVWLARCGVCPLLLMCLFGLWLGIRGLLIRRSINESNALPLAGIALGICALCGWVTAAVVLLNTTESMLK